MSEWVKDNGSYYYYYSDGTMATGWQELDGYWYYFYDDGSMTWSNEVDGYYLGPDGRMVTSEGWVNTKEDNSGTWYYVGGSNGEVVKGWNRIDGDFYYFNYPGGSMTWDNTIDGFYLDNSGKMVSGTGWLQDGITKDWYYFSDGEMQSNDTEDGYHLNSSGKMVTGTGWDPVDSWWYYLDDTGKVVTGWLYDQGNWYYLYPQGSMAEGWIQVNGEWYYLNSSGEMETGWVQDNGNWYYLNSSGEMETGWIKDAGSWYYLNDDGSMAKDTTIDRYYLDATGKWIPNFVPENLSSTQKDAKELLDNQTAVSLTQSDETKDAFAAMNFEKDENGVYHASQPDCWQYIGGYCDFYDYVFNAATSMNKLKYPFKVGDIEYIIWMWKGDYLNLGAGGEVGIYDNEHSIPSVDIAGINTPSIDNIPGLYEPSKDNVLNMTLHASIDGITTIFDWDPGEPNWWITGWNPKFQNIAQENIVLSGTIDFSGYDDLWEEFYDEYEKDEYLTFNTDTHIVDFEWQ
ncbi:cell wall binding repeat-containing protein [Clostridium sp. DL-VIII]|uniref:DUF4474 domain-containing protein n=1 Tax=Clostridium sp. DL-VIII TaxID=641107 RepID=UPI00023AF69A|nr:DUF4474 domain-containing protein [Clostridium sp. DL-VIII]EHI97928.1 cell wall binding repeat-containing protein [Clostridium sp. DL-VIII]